MVKEKKVVNKSVDKKETKKKSTKTVKKITKQKDTIKNVTPKGFKAFKNELEKVKWPDKKVMVKYSVATIVFVLFFGAYFSIIISLFGLIKTLI